jgi:ParB family transcriptional regulator, chromosome partitioning protein
VAHAITGSRLWSVKPEPQATRNATIVASLAASASEAAFAAKRGEVLALLGFSAEEETVAGGNGDDYGTVGIFVRLLPLADDDVMRVLAVIMGETLEAGSAVVEGIGVHLKLDMSAVWQPDDAFFDLIRDRQVVNAMVAEVAGKAVADGNIAEKMKTQKQIIRDCLAGTSGRTEVATWLPGWMQFPARAYTERGGLRTAEQWARVRPLFAE